jgi:hypothetical protein
MIVLRTIGSASISAIVKIVGTVGTTRASVPARIAVVSRFRS